MTDQYPAIYFCEQCLRKWDVKDGNEVTEGPLRHFKERGHSVICVSDLLRPPYIPLVIFKLMDDIEKKKIKKCLNDHMLIAEKCKENMILRNIQDLQRAYQTIQNLARSHKKIR